MAVSQFDSDGRLVGIVPMMTDPFPHSPVMKLFHTDLFVLPLPAGHRFPMQRYRLLRERLEQSQLFAVDQMCVPPAASLEELGRVHTTDWIHRVINGQLTADEIRRIGFPWSQQMAERSRRSTGATIAAARCALANGVAANLAGGTHHAFADRGAGYCVFNDVAVAARTLQQEGLVKSVLVLDGDVHQGDGTAAIFQNDATVTTVSLHAKKAFPARKQQSDFDYELMPESDDDAYLAGWKQCLTWAAEHSQPDIVFFLAGADPYREDKLGGLAVTKAGLRVRDQLLLEFCRDKGLPLAVTLAGGYAEDINDIVDIQFHTITLAQKMLAYRH